MPPGYTVDPDAVADSGRTVCELADDLRTARSTWDRPTRSAAEACGMDLVRDAYTAMQDAWFDEVGVHVTILEQLCESLREAAKGYRDLEDTGAESFRVE